MQIRSFLRSLIAPALLALAPVLSGCVDGTGSQSDDITDVKHTDVERQSIGNCWLYAEASWVESMHLNATGVKYDISQSYWTYWHWYKQIIEEQVSEIETGGFFSVAGEIILERGLIPEAKFVKEDSTSEMSSRQSTALTKMNQELSTGRLKDASSRKNKELVRKVLDEAWQLTSSVKGQITKVFGKDGSKTFDATTLTTKGTSIIAPDAFKVRYTERVTDKTKPTIKDTTLDVAIEEWVEANYPSWGGDTSKRDYQIRVQKALHDAQPVVITWLVDFNAMEGYDAVLKGSFNMTTLKKAGKPGRQGGHMTVLEDYEATTKEFGLLKAGVTLDPNNVDDAKKLAAALLPSTSIKFFRIKNSWGALRDDRASAPGFPGYHDLYMDYLNGPINWCPDAAEPKSLDKCKSTDTPFESVVLPPGY